MLYELERRTGFDLPLRYNIAPTQESPVLRLSPDDGERELVQLRWGLVPFWADDPSVGSRMINARAETAAQKPSFREAFRKRRALIPASGFYEWRKEEGGGKQPYYITSSSKRPFSFAGLWEQWNKQGMILETFTILTTAPNKLVADLHDRMPVIIPEKGYSLWLDPGTDGENLEGLLVPYAGEDLLAYPVSKMVNNPSTDNPELIVPLEK